MNHSLSTTLNHSLNTTLNHNMNTTLNHYLCTTLNHSLNTTLNHDLNTTLSPKSNTTLSPKLNTTLSPKLKTTLIHTLNTTLSHKLNTTLKTIEWNFQNIEIISTFHGSIDKKKIFCSTNTSWGEFKWGRVQDLERLVPILHDDVRDQCDQMLGSNVLVKNQEFTNYYYENLPNGPKIIKSVCNISTNTNKL